MDFPSIRIMAELASKGASLHEYHKPDARSIYGAEALQRMYSSFDIHKTTCLSKRIQLG
jgi:hypothetical protein